MENNQALQTLTSPWLHLIQACISANENPFKYLIALHRNKKDVFKNPDNFLPIWQRSKIFLSHHHFSNTRMRVAIDKF